MKHIAGAGQVTALHQLKRHWQESHQQELLPVLLHLFAARQQGQHQLWPAW